MSREAHGWAHTNRSGGHTGKGMHTSGEEGCGEELGTTWEEKLGYVWARKRVGVGGREVVRNLE
jgi:hypothetical protein